jgi:hypothetical protein
MTVKYHDAVKIATEVQRRSELIKLLHEAGNSKKCTINFAIAPPAGSPLNSDAEIWRTGPAIEMPAEIRAFLIDDIMKRITATDVALVSLGLDPIELGGITLSETSPANAAPAKTE